MEERKKAIENGEEDELNIVDEMPVLYRLG